jgi:hypothetical protein
MDFLGNVNSRAAFTAPAAIRKHRGKSPEMPVPIGLQRYWQVLYHKIKLGTRNARRWLQ